MQEHIFYFAVYLSYPRSVKGKYAQLRVNDMSEDKVQIVLEDIKPFVLFFLAFFVFVSSYKCTCSVLLKPSTAG